MKKIYSKVNPDVLLHIINRQKEVSETRTDLSPGKEYLQVSCFKLNNGKTFKAHKHIENIRETDITQESWIVIKGKVKAILYDIDDTVLEEIELCQGDCSITFRGGHNYLCMEDDTVVYEYKTGPYFGQEKDKEFI
jgi:cupin fold WbuC family metalloprotein